jgi:hypothetical protein
MNIFRTGRLDGHYSPETYHLQPGRIEDYVPGNCSIQEKESKEVFVYSAFIFVIAFDKTETIIFIMSHSVNISICKA